MPAYLPYVFLLVVTLIGIKGSFKGDGEHVGGKILCVLPREGFLLPVAVVLPDVPVARLVLRDRESGGRGDEPAGLKNERSTICFVFIREFDNGDKITIMVSKRNVSLYKGGVPEGDQKRKIEFGPLYDKDHVLRLVKDMNVSAWTRKCGRDIRYLGFSLEDVAELIGMGLDKGRFLGSEWCVQGKNGPWAACDAYEVLRSEWSDVAHKKMPIEYYVKFAINEKGNLLLITSCHL